MAFSTKKEALETVIRDVQMFPGFKAQVKFAFDGSGSLHSEYLANGFMQDMIEKVGAFAIRLDDNGEMESVVFDTGVIDLASATEQNVDTFVSEKILKPHANEIFGGTKIAQAMDHLLNQSALGLTAQIVDVVAEAKGAASSLFARIGQSLFGKKDVPTTSAPVASKKTSKKIPVIIGIVTDGDTSDEDRMYEILEEYEDADVFWLFFPIGHANFTQLLSGNVQKIKNADVIYFENPAKVADVDFYRQVITGTNTDMRFSKISSKFSGAGSSNKLLNWINQHR